MKKYLEILLALSFSSSLWAGATFSRAHNWVDLEVLTASDLNNEFNNILNNLDPAGVDDYSLTLSQMQTTVDPYPAAVESLATDLKGEIERLRYQILQLKKAIQTTDSTYWYQDAPGQGTFTIGTSSVGVNNTSPSYSLDVVGTIRTSSATISPTVVVSSITSTLPSVYITTNATVTGNLTVNGSYIGNFSASNVDNTTIEVNSGNLRVKPNGIGGTSLKQLTQSPSNITLTINTLGQPTSSITINNALVLGVKATISSSTAYYYAAAISWNNNPTSILYSHSGASSVSLNTNQPKSVVTFSIDGAQDGDTVTFSSIVIYYLELPTVTY